MSPRPRDDEPIGRAVRATLDLHPQRSGRSGRLRGRNPQEREPVRNLGRAIRDQTTSERHAMDYLRGVQSRRAKEDRIGYVIGPPTHAR